MALQGTDPNMFQITEILSTNDSAENFAIQNGLLPNLPTVGFLANRPDCTTVGCNGNLYIGTINGKRVIRCPKCKKKISLKNGPSGIGGHGGTWFARFDILHRPNVKLSTKQILIIIYLWSKEVGVKQAHGMLGDLIGENNNTLVDWMNYIRELLFEKMENAAQMGGVNEIVEIDESYFRGRRKNATGRALLGDRVPPARQNYGDAVNGPWVFGMVHKRPDGALDRRFFQVPRRDAATLLPIIQRHVLPGTTIMSDEWAAYNGLGNLGYNHQTVNHTYFFVDPLTGNNTQRIESCWGAAKTKIMRVCRGTTPQLMKGHLAEFWWRGFHKDNPFCAIIQEIRAAYPQ